MQVRQSRVNFDNYTISIEKGEIIGDIIDKLKVNMPVGKCPVCGEDLVIRRGKYGLFIGCAGFKNGCRKTYNPKFFKVFNDMDIMMHRKGFELKYGLIIYNKRGSLC